MPAEHLVVGGTVAALVAADAIAAAGRPVRLVLPERGVGGGFAARAHEGRTLELGVRLLELAFEDTAAATPALDDYDPATTGHRPWTAVVDAWVRALTGDRLREIGRPAMVLDGRRVDDVLFTVDLTALPGELGAAERARMLGEVRGALASPGMTGAGVLDPAHVPALATLDLETASLANHGATFHRRIIAPLCDKVLTGGAAAVSAPLRRKVWAPLFHPRTLAEALAGAPVGFRPRRPLHTLDGGGCGLVVDALLDRLRARPTATITTGGTLEHLEARPGGDVLLRFSGQDDVQARRPILALSADALFHAAGVPYGVQRVRTALAWLEADAADAADVPELVHVLDPSNPVLRVSRGGAAAHPGRALLTVELRHDHPEADLARAAAAGLADAGLLDPGTATTTVTTMARPTFPVPDVATLTAFAAARARFATLGLDVELAGGALDVTADTLNDQILQGLRASARTS